MPEVEHGPSVILYAIGTQEFVLMSFPIIEIYFVYDFGIVCFPLGFGYEFRI